MNSLFETFYSKLLLEITPLCYCVPYSFVPKKLVSVQLFLGQSSANLHLVLSQFLQPNLSQSSASDQPIFSQSSASFQPVFSQFSAGLQLVLSQSSAGPQLVSSVRLQPVISQFSARLQPVFSQSSGNLQPVFRQSFKRLSRLVISASMLKDI